MLKKRLNLLVVAIFLLGSVGYAQNAFNPVISGMNGENTIHLLNEADKHLETDLVQSENERLRIEAEILMARSISKDWIPEAINTTPLNGNRDLMDLIFSFPAAGQSTWAVSTDGKSIYTVCTYGIPFQFFKYEPDGTNPRGFDVEGVETPIRALTYDGQYFYAASGADTQVQVIDLENETLIGTVTMNGVGAIRHISYDPNLDWGNGGFWAGNYTTLGAFSKTGGLLIPFVPQNFVDVYGTAYDNKSDPANPCLWFSCYGNTLGAAVIKKFDINTRTITDFQCNMLEIEGVNSGSGAAGATMFHHTATGKYLFMIITQVTNTVYGFEVGYAIATESPGAPTEFSFTPNATGELNSVIAWKNPSVDIAGEELTELTSIDVYENDVLIHTVNSPVMGANASYTATVAEKGLYVYRVVPVNSIGEGADVRDRKWVGPDMPAAPSNAVLVKEGDWEATLSWTAPAEGLHGGYFTSSGLVYDIYRNGTNLVVENHTSTTFAETITQAGILYYRIVAKNAAGTGGEVNSNNVNYFDIVTELPYIQDFSSENFPPPSWETVMLGDGGGWVQNTMYYTSAPNSATHNYGMTGSHGWLISPPIQLPSEEGSYLLSFWSRHQVVMASYFFNGSSAVYVSTGSNEPLSGDFEAVHLFSITDAQANNNKWDKYYVSLNDYVGQQVFIGFRHMAGMYSHAWWIDDIEVAVYTGAKIDVTPNPLVMGTAYNNDPFPFYQSEITIINRGAVPLIISDIPSIDSQLKIYGLPATIPAYSELQVTVDFDPIDVPAGAWTGNIVLATNDPDMPQYNVTVNATVAAMTILNFVDENWNAGAPPGWVYSTSPAPYTGMTRITNRGVDNTPCIIANINSSNYLGWARTPYLIMGDNPIMSFMIDVHNLSGYPNPANPNDFSFWVTISTDGGITWDEVHNVGQGEYIQTGGFQRIHVDVSAYANEICLIQFNCQRYGYTSNNVNLWLFVDDFVAGTPGVYDDLTAHLFSGVLRPTVLTNNEYKLTVKNSSYTTTINGDQYTVRLMLVNNEGEDIELDALNGIDIEPLERGEFIFTWTPQVSGQVFIYGEILLPSDHNPADNKTANTQINVMPENMMEVYTINGTEALQRTPIDLMNSNSVIQTLYLRSDMGANAGTIEMLTLYVAPSNPQPAHENIPITIWLGETEQTRFEGDGFVDPTTFTKVWEGNVNFNRLGDWEFTVQFDTPYEYKGGNLILYTWKAVSPGAFGVDFRGSTINNSFRQVLRNSIYDNNIIDPMNPYVGGHNFSIWHWIANATFGINRDGTGSISGVVSDEEGEPISGVALNVDGFNKTTNSAGEYKYPILEPDTYNLSATMFGYYNVSEPVDVDADVETIHNITMILRDLYTVSGTVTGNDAPGGLEGVTITLSGYGANKTATTQANGTFLIEDVYDAFTYNVSATKAGYVTHTGTVTVDGANEVLNFKMNEVAYPATNVTAALNEDEDAAIINWTAPAKDNPSKVFVGYNVLRLLKGDAEDLWDQIATNITATTFTDEEWDSLDGPAVFRYAVKVVYTDNVLSVATQSNDLPKGMYVEFIVNITTNDGSPATGANVTLTNRDSEYPYVYELTSGANGVTFPEVWRGFYNISVRHPKFFEAIATNIDITVPGQTTINISEKNLPVYSVASVKDAPDVITTWTEPVAFEEVSYILDSGVADRGWGINPNAAAGLGNKYEVGEKGEITSIDIYGMYNNLNTNRVLTVRIYNEAQQLIGESAGFTMASNGWVNVPVNNFVYDQTFYAIVWWPSTTGASHWLGFDWNGLPGVNLMNNFYVVEGRFMIFSNVVDSPPGVFMIRINANEYETGGKTSYGYTPLTVQKPEITDEFIFVNNAEEFVMSSIAPECISPVKLEKSTRAVNGYKVFRLEVGTPESAWEEIVESTMALTFTDEDVLDVLPANSYQHAVKVIYTDNFLSRAVLGNVWHVGLEAEVSLTVTTNGGDPVNGAQVLLTNQNGNPDYVYRATMDAATVVFPIVWKGAYTLTVVLEGYQRYTLADIEITDDVQTLTPVQLIEIIEDPFNLEVETDAIVRTALFSWNNVEFEPFNDSFEDYNNWLMNDFGEWKTVDLNGGPTSWFTHSGGNFEYPGRGLPHAFIVFNPSQTMPPIGDQVVMPHSGDKYLLAMPALNPPNNGWLIRKVSSNSNMTLSLWAKSAINNWGLERFRVAYSVTGNDPADFVYVLTPGDYQEAPVQWTKFNYTVPRSAKYFAINCVSNDAFAFLIDDVSLQLAKGNSRGLKGYNVYLDGVKVANEITATDFLFEDLAAKDYVAEVEAVYVSGVSGKAELSFTMPAIPKYNITVSANNDEWGSVKGGGTYEHGTSVKVEAEVNDGYLFVHWTENGSQVSTTTEYTFSATKDRDLVAVFAEIAVFNVTFVVTNLTTGETITDATVEFDGEEILGYVAENVLPGVHNYKVTKAGFDEASGTVTVINADREVEVKLAPSGIKDNILSRIVLSPNPFKNEINISDPSVVKNIQITNVAGQKVKEVTFNGKSITTKELTDGVYFVTIESVTGDKAVYKMVKK